ncbi:Rha family transcriptional regulator [Paracoccus yeei]|uniref:Rha family transcriptional regulator n=1 Tax=Paracoccus yeei TaxID=147645 RepID=UPI001C8D736E|nr:phage regulatory protein/antirepressor Ant [Paracoccus yeei]MBY0138375.1 phage regulatory protein/antirepressor Ant [Paracoccus yeei]
MREPETNEAAGTAIPAASMNPTIYERASAMNMLANAEDFNGIVIEQRDGLLVTSSLGVADRFEKRHADVLRAIEGLECSNDFIKRNFAFYTYRPEGARRDFPCVGMTRDGFTFLVMGFTGKDAAAWKERYIAAFNAMETRLRQSSQIDLSDPAQLVPLLTSYAQRTQVAEARVAAMSPKAEAFEVLEASEGSQLPRVVAKTFSVPERKFFRWLHANSWAFRQGKTWQGYSEKIKQGYLEHEPHTYTVPETGEERTKVQLKITPKGIARLAQIFAKEGKPE